MCDAGSTGTYTQEVPFVLLDLVTDVLVEQQLTEDERAHGLHIQTLSLCQDLFISPIDGSTLLFLLQEKKKSFKYLQFSLKLTPKTLSYGESVRLILKMGVLFFCKFTDAVNNMLSNQGTLTLTKL